MRGPSATGLAVGVLAYVWILGGSVGAVARNQNPQPLDRAAAIDIEGLVGEDGDVPLVDLGVNEPIPLWAMRPVPNALLERLPPLPHAIGYRLVADALILWDTHAEILIDALSGTFVEP